MGTPVEYRRNLFVNPCLSTVQTGWTATVGTTGGSQTVTRETADGPVIEGVQRNFLRQKWVTVGTGALGSTGILVGSPSVDYTVIKPGLSTTISVYARSSVPNRNAYLSITSHTSAGGNQVVEGTTGLSQKVIGPDWTRLSATIVPSPDQGRLYVRIYNIAGSGSPNHQVGDTLDATCFMVEQTDARVSRAETRRNLLRNPSFEVDTSSWSGTRGTIARANTPHVVTGAGTWGIKYTSTDAATVNGNYVWHSYVPVTEGVTYSLAASVEPIGAGTVGQKFRAHITWYDDVAQVGSSSAGSDTTCAANVMTRVTVAGAVAPPGATRAQLFVTPRLFAVPVGEGYYVEAGQLTATAAASSYFDGDTLDTAGIDYAWAGTAHASESVESTTTLVDGQAVPGTYFDGDTADVPDVVLYDWAGTPNLSQSIASWPVADEPVPVAPGFMGPYPLPDDRHYYGLPDASPFVHSGEVPPSDYVPPAEGEDYVPPPPPPEVSPDRDAIVLIQAKVGATPTGVFDEETVSQVIAWRRKWMADEEEYVDLPAWQRMDEVPDPVPTVVGTQFINTEMASL